MNSAAELTSGAAAIEIGLAAAANMLAKGAMTWLVGGRRMGSRVATGYAVALALGAAAAAWFPAE